MQYVYTVLGQNKNTSFLNYCYSVVTVQNHNFSVEKYLLLLFMLYGFLIYISVCFPLRRSVFHKFLPPYFILCQIVRDARVFLTCNFPRFVLAYFISYFYRL